MWKTEHQNTLDKKSEEETDFSIRVRMCGKQSEHSARPPSLSSYSRGSNGSPAGSRSTQPLILKMRVLNLDFRDIGASILHFVDLSKRFKVESLDLCFTATGIDTTANGRRVASEKCENHFFELQTHWPEAQQRRSYISPTHLPSP